MIKPIPTKIRDELAKDQFMAKCCLKDESCYGKIEWHHNLISYENGNKGRSNDKSAILPVCQFHHDRARTTWCKEKLDYIMFKRGLDISKYPKSDLKQRKQYLELKFGII